MADAVIDFIGNDDELLGSIENLESTMEDLGSNVYDAFERSSEAIDNLEYVIDNLAAEISMAFSGKGVAAIGEFEDEANSVDLSKMEGEVKESLANIESRLDGLSSKVGGALKGVIALFSIEKIKAWGGELLRAAGETEEFGGRVDVLSNMFLNVQQIIGGKLVPVVEYLSEVGIQTFTALQTGVENLGATWELAWTSMQLVSVGLYEDLKHFFSAELPAYLGWLQENWQNVFLDIYEFDKTVLSNMWENIKMFFENVYKWLSGEETTWEWKGLTEGFESSLNKLPEIAARKKSDLEKSLEVRMNAAADTLGGSFVNNLSNNKDAINKAQPGVSKETLKAQEDQMKGWGEILKGGLKDLGQTLGEVNNETLGEFPELVAVLTGDTSKKKEEKKDEFSGVESITALFARIQNSALSPAEKAADDTAKNTKATATATEKVADKVDKTTTAIKGLAESIASGLSNLVPRYG